MKNFNLAYLKAMCMTFVFMALAAVVFGQVEPDPNSNPQGWFQYQYELIYGAVVLLGGYLTKVIPGVKNLNGIIRVLSWAIVSFLAFKFMAPISAIGAAVTYAITTSIYEVFLSWFKKDPATGASPTLLVNRR